MKLVRVGDWTLNMCNVAAVHFKDLGGGVGTRARVHFVGGSNNEPSNLDLDGRDADALRVFCLHKSEDARDWMGEVNE